MNRKILTGIMAFVFILATISNANATLTINKPINDTYVQYGNPLYDVQFSVYNGNNSKDCYVNYGNGNIYLINESLKGWNITYQLWSGYYTAIFNCTNATGINTWANSVIFTIEAHSANILALLLASMVVIVLIAGMLYIQYERMQAKKVNLAELSTETLIGIILIACVGMVIAGL